MTISTTYHLGGYQPDAPAGNKAAEDDTDAGTHTEWDTEGNVTVQRPLTADEIAALTPPQPAVDPVQALATQLLAAAPQLADALAKVAASNSAKAPLQVLTDALTAAHAEANDT